MTAICAFAGARREHGPVWTPLIRANFGEKGGGSFGQDMPKKRPGQPNEVASRHLFVFVACEDSPEMTGQVLHPNGGAAVRGCAARSPR